MTTVTAPSNIVTAVERWAASSPSAIAVRRKLHGIWAETTWAELDAQVVATSRGLRSIGVKHGDIVAILGENSLDWVVADLAIRRSGATVLPLPTLASPEQIAGWLNESSVSVVFCGDQEHTDKIVASGAAVDTLVPSDATGVATYSAITIIAQSDLREAGSAADHPAESNDLAAIQPTSDGLVAVTDSALASAAFYAVTRLDLSASDRIIAIAPFSDAVSRSVDVYATLLAGGQLHFSETLTSVPDDLREVMPTVLSGPRRVFELVHQESLLRSRETGRLRRRLIRWGMEGDRPRRGLRAAMITRPIARQHGLSHLRWAVVTGDERLSRSTSSWLTVLAIPLVHAWGSARAGGVAITRSAAESGAIDLSTLTPHDRTLAEGWASQVDGSALHVGLAARIEAEMREHPCIRRVILRDGDAVVELDLEATANWATDNGIEFGTRASLASTPAIARVIDKEAQRVNAAVGTPAIKRIAIASREFSVTDGDLSPTLEVDRARVHETFAARIKVVTVKGDTA